MPDVAAPPRAVARKHAALGRRRPPARTPTDSLPSACTGVGWPARWVAPAGPGTVVPAQAETQVQQWGAGGRAVVVPACAGTQPLRSRGHTGAMVAPLARGRAGVHDGSSHPAPAFPGHAGAMVAPLARSGADRTRLAGVQGHQIGGLMRAIGPGEALCAGALTLAASAPRDRLRGPPGPAAEAGRSGPAAA